MAETRAPRLETPLAQNIKRLRDERGWTLAQLEERTGVRLQLLSMIERGERPNPTLETLQGLSQGLGVPIDELVGAAPGEGPTPPALQRLVDQGYLPDLTLDELRKLKRAAALFGVEFSAKDYFDLVAVLRRDRGT